MDFFFNFVSLSVFIFSIYYRIRYQVTQPSSVSSVLVTSAWRKRERCCHSHSSGARSTRWTEYYRSTKLLMLSSSIFLAAGIIMTRVCFLLLITFYFNAASTQRQIEKAEAQLHRLCCGSIPSLKNELFKFFRSSYKTKCGVDFNQFCLWHLALHGQQCLNSRFPLFTTRGM